MLAALVKFSLQFRGLILVLAALLIGYGLYVAESAKLDVFPDFVQPQVAVQTECPGLAPEQVELLVTAQVESALLGLTDLESLRSESIEGLSIITAVFREGSDIFRARQAMAEKLGETAGRLPLGIRAPRMTPLTSSTMDLLKIGLVSDRLGPMELRTFADWTLKPRLLSVPGVAKCSAFGGEVRQLQVQVLPEKLLAHGLSLSDVLAAARAATLVSGAGFIETANQRITLQTEVQYLTAELLGQVVVAYSNGLSVCLRDVAVVGDGPEPKQGDTLIMGRPGVLLTMNSQFGANTLQVTHALEAALGELKPMFEREGVQVYPRLHRPATFIETALGNMRHSLLLGGCLVAIVLVLLVGSFRTACISLAAIPLSLLTAVIVLDWLGVTINTMTLGGLAIALGEVVDDSIIDVENIFRRVREHQARLAGTGETMTRAGVFRVVLDASLEVRQAVVYATFVVAVIFLPVLSLTGLQGSFFSPLALSYILAILASLLVALTVTPALALLLFRKGARHPREPFVQRWLKTGYGRMLLFVEKWPRAVIAAVVVIVLFTLTRLPSSTGTILPEFREGHYVLQVFTIPGTSLPEMLRLGERISVELLKIPRIDTVEQQIGRAELGEDPWSPNRCEFHVELKSLSGRDHEIAGHEIEEVLRKFPGITFEVLTFLGDRIGETISGETAPVVVSIFGDDLNVLDEKAAEVALVLSSVSSKASAVVKAPPGAPRVNIRLRHDRLAQFGFRPAEVLEPLQAAYQGAVVAQTSRANQAIDVVVILPETERQDPQAVGSLLLTSSEGRLLPLREVADVFPGTGRSSILHEGGRRRQTVTCTVRGMDVGEFVNLAKPKVASEVQFPKGTYAIFSGAAQAQEKAKRQLLMGSGVAVVGVFLLLSLAFHHWRNLFLVMANLPFALVGGVLALWISNLAEPEANPLTIGSLVGFVTLFGISTRNSIMMISHFEHLVQRERVEWGPEAVLRGASERLMPVLMTATVTALALLPLALGAGEAGREIEGPMALVILGGLATSTALNLLVLPVLALRYGRFAPLSPG